MLKRNVCFTVLIVVALLAAVVLSACAGAAPKQHTLKLVGNEPAPEERLREDIGTPDISVGDRTSASKDMFDESGKKVGQLHIVGVYTDPADEPDEVHHQVLVIVVLSLEDGSTIIGLGLHLTEAPDVVTERAVIGGTGKYVGASGVWTAQRAADGTWTYTFTFTTPQ
jgi:ABC-type Fe3+-hydroxamate transport system substrate-binding protein